MCSQTTDEATNYSQLLNLFRQAINHLCFCLTQKITKRFIDDINDEDNDDIYDIADQKKSMFESIIYLISDDLFFKASFIKENDDRFAVRTTM